MVINGPTYLFHEGDPVLRGDEQLLPVVDLVIDSSDPNHQFRDNQRWDLRVLDRDNTDFGAIAGQFYTGQDAAGNNHWDFFVLIPELPGQ